LNGSGFSSYAWVRHQSHNRTEGTMIGIVQGTEELQFRDISNENMAIHKFRLKLNIVFHQKENPLYQFLMLFAIGELIIRIIAKFFSNPE
jgi:hypothetical protein